MRIAAGCHLRASSDHLHAETQLLPNVKSLEVCVQYLASALSPYPSISHNSNPTIWSTKPEGHPSVKIPTKNFGSPYKQYNSNRRIRADIQRNSHPSSLGSYLHPASKPHHLNSTAYSGPSGKKPFLESTEKPFHSFVQGFAKP